MPQLEGSISAEQLRRILEVSRLLAVTTELDALLEQIAQAATELLDCERASIFVHDSATDELCTTVALQSEIIRVPSGTGIVGHVFTNNVVLHVPKPYEDPRFNPQPDRRSGFITRNLLSAPMSDLNHKPLGVIQAINNRSAEGFDKTCEGIIQLLADQAGVALQRYRLQQSALHAMYLKSEMEMAKRVQEELIPHRAPAIAGLEGIGWTKAASVTGGDAYDLWETHDGKMGLFVGDASGHGLGAAMMIAQTRAMVRAIGDLKSDAHEVMRHVNERLAEDLPPGNFVTAFVGFVAGDGTIEWSAAGHGPMLVRREATAKFELLEPPAQPLGIVDFFSDERAGPLHLGSGGTLVVVSDGVLDARDPTGQMFDAPRLIATLDSARSEGLEAQLQITRALIDWQRKEEPTDDQTIVMVRKS